MNDIYFDNSATTALCAEARTKMTEAMDCYGNPSSLHKYGVDAGKLLREARESILAALGIRTASTGALVFTSCGTEATNLALFGTAHAKARRTAHKIVITDSEHPSVENTARALEKDGFEIVRIPTKNGVLDEAALDHALDRNVFLVSLMLVNNETGARYAVEKAFRLAKTRNPEVITHCDAVQGFLKCKFTPMSLGADLITLSAHKIHGPKGVGALYIDKKLLTKRAIVTTLPGGGQENGLRSGTENMIGIVGFGAAARVGTATLDADLSHLSSLRNYAIERLSALELRLNLPEGETAPHILNMTLPDIRSETMLHFLSSKGIYVSAGSACSSHDAHPSSSLLAFGIPAEEAGHSIRVSFAHTNTTEEIDRFVTALDEGLRSLVRVHRGRR
jgi:cysteine desulfurase